MDVPRRPNRSEHAARIVLILFSILTLDTVPAELRADSPSTQATLFDPARHMRIEEVRPGMTGYGLSVFYGTKIERFDVEVVSILRDFNPKLDVVLIRCHGHDLEHTGPVAGMSGSPIFLRDETGRDRMIGALAYGWSLQKDPLVGVQPIQYMLELPAKPVTTDPSEATLQNSSPDSLIDWNLQDVRRALRARLARAESADESSSRSFLGDGQSESAGLRPLVTPLLSAGLPAELAEQYRGLFKSYGLTMLQAGGGSTSPGDADVKLERGSVLAAPMLTGDVDLAAVGTCTELIGDRFVGFGHSFNGEGPVSLPVAAGEVQAIVARLDQSFKLGSPGKILGTLQHDETTGVAGQLGAAPAMIPIDLQVKYTDGSQDEHYHFNCALHPKLTPLLASVAVSSALAGAHDLPQYHTDDYALKLEFANGKSIDLNNRAVNADPSAMFAELALPIAAAADNPFERVPLKSISGTVTVSPHAREAEILFVNVPKLKFRPGEKVKAYLTYRPFRAAEAVLPIEFELPRDLPDGPYDLTISDWQRYLSDEAAAEPFRFSAESSREVFDVIRDFTAIRHNAVYVRLVRQADGIAVGRAAMPRLPSSRREVLLDAGRSNITAFVSSAVKTIPTENVMDGSADFEITIDSEAHVEVGASPHNAQPKSESPGGTPPTAGNASEEKPKSGKPDKEKPEPPKTEPPKSDAPKSDEPH